MDRRKEAILRAITHDYIETAEPVGSRTIARKYNLGVSPATIRNEMADLEESGYLQQPHTSAGRIPSDKGYRFYVDVLMQRPEVSEEDLLRLRHRVQLPPAAVEEMLRRATRLLAALTNYAGVAIMPSLKDTVVRAVQFVPIDERNVLVVVVTEPGFVQNRMVEATDVSPEQLIRVGWQVTQELRGKTQRELGATICSEVANIVDNPLLSETLMEMLVEGLVGGNEKVFLKGATNLIDQPEFREIAKARELLTTLEERERLLEMIGSTIDGTNVAIGAENPHVEMRECSVVSATYRVDGRVVGAIGVIGPTRMEYTRAIALVESMAETLSDVFGVVGRS